MFITDAEEHRASLEAVLLRHASERVSLEIVENVASWAVANHVTVEGNPLASAIPARNGLSRSIVLQRKMDENDTAGILGRLDFGGHSRERSLLVNPKLFLRHTVLHELAHLENNWGQAYEDECDSWAFERLSAQWRG